MSGCLPSTSADSLPIASSELSPRHLQVREVVTVNSTVFYDGL